MQHTKKNRRYRSIFTFNTLTQNYANKFLIFCIGFLLAMSVIIFLVLGDLYNSVLHQPEMCQSSSFFISQKVYTLKVLIFSCFLFSIIGVTLFSYFVFHRFSGPKYVIRQYIQSMIKGNYHEPRTLRKNDEFKDVLDDLAQLAETLKKKS